MHAATPSNYLVSPTPLNGPGLPLRVGRAVHQVEKGSQVKMIEQAGKPVAIIKTPANTIRELHPGGELRLSKSQQDRRRAKHFPQSK